MKEFLARLIINFILVSSLMVAIVSGLGIVIALLEYLWKPMILCIVLCALCSSIGITIGSIR